MFSVSPRLNGYKPDESIRFLDQAREAIGALPGVTGVTTSAASRSSPATTGARASACRVFRRVRTPTSTRRRTSSGRTSSGRWKDDCSSGREFRPADKLDAPKVAIVNETFARKFNLGRDAVGKRMSTDPAKELDIEIVGLAADMKYSEVKDNVPPQIYLPYWQDRFLGSATFYVRSSGRIRHHADPGCA